MGQKVHPNLIRLGIINKWNSIWYANKKNFSVNLKNDFIIRKFIMKKFSNALISKIMIERNSKTIKITIHTSRPGIIIGKKGEDVEQLRKNITNMSGFPSQVNIIEVNKPELDAKLISNNIANQLERRVMFRRAMKRAIQNAMRFGAKGIKIEISGRLGGAEIARKEWIREGRVPLHTFRANIDFSISEAKTTYGVIGVKVWIFKGEILDNKNIY
ncbi:MAG: 30S ribosomal protein S3 [Candidatus Makana argininalis]